MIQRLVIGLFLVLCSRLAYAFVLSGRITEGTNLVNGVAVAAGSNVVTSGVDGVYLFTNLSGHYVVTPTQAGQVFNPLHRTLVMQGGLTNVNFERGFSNLTTIITTCDASSLVAAATMSGKIEFDCDGVIVITNQLYFTNSVSLDGRGHTVTLDGGKTSRVFYLYKNAAALANLTIVNGTARTNTHPIELFFNNMILGGGIFSYAATVTISACTFVSNTAHAAGPSSATTGGGGAIYAERGAYIVSNSSFTANSCVGNFASGGGVFYFASDTSSIFSIQQCLFSKNACLTDSSTNSGSLTYGGALILEGSPSLRWNASMGNCTFFSNSVRDLAGANAGPNVLSLSYGLNFGMTNCTFVGNHSDANVFQTGLSMGIITTSVRSCIFQDRVDREISGKIIDTGFNVADDNPTFSFISFTNSTSRHNATNTLVDSLAYHGGPTMTCALLPGSAGLDAVTNGTLPAVDQRGALRPFGAAPDIGALEMYPTQFVIASLSPTGSDWRVAGNGQPVTPFIVQQSPNLMVWSNAAIFASTPAGSFEGTTSNPVPNRNFFRILVP